MVPGALPFPQIDPVIFSIGPLSLRWYALAYIVGFVLAWRMVIAFVNRPGLWGPQGPALTRDHADDLLTWIILGAVLGGRLGYVLFYNAGFYLQNPVEIVKIWEGGMSFHGGLLGVAAAIWLFSRKYGLREFSVGDVVSISATPGLLFGRLANFINAELWGRPTDLPWGVIFPGQAAQDCAAVAGLCARHPSQLYEAALEGLILGAILVWLAWRRGWLRYEGALFGMLLMGYGLARFAVEFVRQPDAQFISEGNPLGLAWHIGGWGLTQGQALSLPMIAIGLWLIRRGRSRV